MGEDLQLTYDLGLLEKSEHKWKHSAGLRTVYHSLFDEMLSCMVPGPSLELGSGIGNLKECIHSVITSDLVKTRYVDLACSAYAIPPPEQPADDPRWANILAMDVLHHLCRPMDFFKSAADVLRPGGRIILIEPAATPFGRLFYTLFHSEPIAPGKIAPPFVLPPDTPDGQFANMGMALSLFKKHRRACLQGLDELGLRLSQIRYRDLLAYPLTGGYSGPQLSPAFLLKGLLRLESHLPQWILRQLALRMVVVIRKERDLLPG